MDRFFSMDNKFFTFMSRVADLIILNILCLLCCIPVVTIGPSLTALFYVTLKMVRNEESYIARGFFKSFKENLKQGIVINLIMLLVGGVLYLDFRIVSRSSASGSGRVMTILLLIALIFYMMLFTYIYPLLAKFVNTVRNTFTNALLMSLRHLPYTALMIAISLLPFIVFYFSPSGQIQALVLLFSIMMGVSTIAFVNSFFFVKIFDLYLPKEIEEAEAASDPARDTDSAFVKEAEERASSSSENNELTDKASLGEE